MSHKQDYWERLRSSIVPPIGVLVQFINETFRQELYVTSESRRNQFVGRVKMDEEEFEEVLHDNGFERNPLASLKNRFGGEVEEGSFRKLYPEDDDRFQLHVILYDGSEIQNANTGETFIYAHWEYRWDVHPWKHYRGYDLDADEGVRKMRKILRIEGIDYEFIQP